MFALAGFARRERLPELRFPRRPLLPPPPPPPLLPLSPAAFAPAAPPRRLRRRRRRRLPVFSWPESAPPPVSVAGLPSPAASALIVMLSSTTKSVVTSNSSDETSSTAFRRRTFLVATDEPNPWPSICQFQLHTTLNDRSPRADLNLPVHGCVPRSPPARSDRSACDAHRCTHRHSRNGWFRFDRRTQLLVRYPV